MRGEAPNRKHLGRIPVLLSLDKRIVYFVTVCCSRRRAIFVTDTAVRIALESLIRCAARTEWQVPQICVMPDHVHMVLLPMREREQSLSKPIQRWKSSSKQRLNRAGIVGDIWQGEFFDRLLRSDEDLTEKWRYVEANPVRAGLCAQPAQYPYLGPPTEILEKL